MGKSKVGDREVEMCEMRTERHDINGYEHLDTTPIEIPIELRNPDPVAQAVINVLAARDFRESLARNDVESPEEFNDFEVPGDEPVPTPYEVAGDERLDALILVKRRELAKMEREKLLRSKEVGNGEGTKVDIPDGGGLREGAGSKDVGKGPPEKGVVKGGSGDVGSVGAGA